MSLYYAAVKYAVNATDAEKVSALKRGIEDCALALFEEFGLSLDEVEDVLTDAASTLDQANDWIASQGGTDAG